MHSPSELLIAFHRFVFFGLGDKIVYDRPRTITTVTMIISLILCSGLIKIQFKDDFRGGYFLADSQSVREHDTYLEFYDFQKMPYMMALLGESSDGGSMLREEYFMEMKKEIDRSINSVLPKADFYHLNSFRLKDFMIYSTIYQFNLIERSFFHWKSPEITLDYPYMRVGSKSVSMRHILYGKENGTFSILRFLMVFNASDPQILSKIKANELMWYQKLKERTKTKVNLHLLGDHIVDHEIRQASINTIYYFLIGALVMTAIVYRIIWQYGQNNTLDNIYLTLITIFCPLLAGVIAISLFSLFNVAVSSTMFVVPFLVFGVGVDDAFLLIHHWLYSRELGSDRLCRMYVEVGPSITLSSLTNIGALMIGYTMSPSADIARFCLCGALAMMTDWILNFFLFTPLMIMRCNHRALETRARGFHVKPTIYKVYLEKLRMNDIRFQILFLLMILWIVSAVLILGMKENFAPEKTFDGRSHLAKSFHLLDKMYSDHEMVTIIKQNLTSDVSQLKANLDEILSNVDQCRDFSTWIHGYESMYNSSSNESTEYFKQVPAYMELYPDILGNTRFITLENGTSQLSKVSFDVCVRGVQGWRNRALQARRIRQKLPDGYTMFLYDSHIFDMILSIRGTVLLSVGITTLAMAVICAFFVPTFKVAFIAIICLLSIILCVVASLSALNADMDGVLMVNVIMAIGMIVDYVAHISYHICLNQDKTCKLTPSERMAQAMHAVCGPTLHAALTTMACVFPLLFHEIHMYVVFAKTVILCSLFGFIHAAFVLPFLLLMLESAIGMCWKDESKHQMTTTQMVSLSNGFAAQRESDPNQVDF